METIEKEIELGNLREVNIEPFCCIHIGNPGFDREKFLERIDAVRRERSRYAIFMGDYADAIYPRGDRRYDPETVQYFLPMAYDAEEQEKTYPAVNAYKWMRDAIRPIRNKVLLASSGNHDDVHRVKYGGTDMVKEFITEPLGITYGKIAWNLDLTVTKGDTSYTYRINGNHGSYMGRYVGGNLNRLMKLPMGFEADIYLRGHTHQLAYTSAPYFTRGEDGGTVEKQRYFAAVGSFLKSYVEGQISYAEKRDYLPLPIGTLSFSLNENGKIDFHK